MSDETIEVLGCEAKRTGEGYEARTPLGLVWVHRSGDSRLWAGKWWPHKQRVCITLMSGESSPADAAREATRRLRAIQRTCARAGAA